jgi:hypothetical protein
MYAYSHALLSKCTCLSYYGCKLHAKNVYESDTMCVCVYVCVHVWVS